MWEENTIPHSTQYPIRLDILVHTMLEEKGISREKIKKAIHEGCVSVNGVLCTSASKKIYENDEISLRIPESSSTIQAEEGDIEVLYEDEHLLVLNKEANTVVHPCQSTPQGTLLQRLLFHYPELEKMGGERPAIVHRLDKDTTGLLLVARTEQARYALVQQFSNREIIKYYIALVEGKTPLCGVLEEKIARDATHKRKMSVHPHGKEAYTEYTRIHTWCDTTSKNAQEYSLLLVRIATGRTHQIRVHLSHCGYPIVGDILYGAKGNKHVQRPLLHAFALFLEHPVYAKPMHYIQAPPEDFIYTYTALQRKHCKVIITGSAGSGKSNVLNFFTQKGIPTCSTDDIVAQLYMEGNSLWHYFMQSYGDKFFVYSTNGTKTIDKAKIIATMQENATFRKEVERISHEFVSRAVQIFWAEHAYTPYSVVEVPLYCESTIFQKNAPADILIVVGAEEELRKERMKKKGWSTQKISYIMENQYSDEQRKEYATYVIENNGSIIELEKECANVQGIIEEYKAKEEALYHIEYQRSIEQCETLVITKHGQ